MNSGGEVYIPGAVRPRGLIPPAALIDEVNAYWTGICAFLTSEQDSPLYDDAVRRQRYEEYTIWHPSAPLSRLSHLNVDIMYPPSERSRT